MLSPGILVPAVLNGLLTGAVYALVALGLTLIYGVLHIINFAHGALLSAALFAAFFVYQKAGIDPYLAVLVLAPAFFGLGFARRRARNAVGDARLGGLDRKRASLRVSRRYAYHRSSLCVQDHRSGVHI